MNSPGPLNPMPSLQGPGNQEAASESREHLAASEVDWLMTGGLAL